MLHQFTYELNIEPAEPVTEATLYLPVPSQNGEPALSTLVDDTVAHLPSTWTNEVIQTDRGPMLSLEATEIDPAAGPYYPTVSVDVSREIDTREALDTEPGLSSRSSVEQVDCDFPYPDRWEGRLRCYRYQSALYGEYPEEVSTVISVGLSGANSWWQGGWNGNEYSNRVSGSVTGKGWITASASFLQGSGNYR